MSLSLCAQPATGMHLEERLARQTGSNGFRAALGAWLSPPLSNAVYSYSSACSVFCVLPHTYAAAAPPLPRSRSPSVLLLSCSLSLFFSFVSALPFSPLLTFLCSSGTTERQRDLLNAFECRRWTSREGMVWMLALRAFFFFFFCAVYVQILEPFSPELYPAPYKHLTRDRCESCHFCSPPCLSVTQAALLIGL